MLNPFPIMWLSLFAYFLLRFAVGGCLVILGYRQLARGGEIRPIARLFLLLQMLTGGMIVTGFSTQYAALVGMAICLVELFGRSNTRTMPRLFYALLFISLLSLFITGAGVFAFDLPL